MQARAGSSEVEVRRLLRPFLEKIKTEHGSEQASPSLPIFSSLTSSPTPSHAARSLRHPRAPPRRRRSSEHKRMSSAKSMMGGESEEARRRERDRNRERQRLQGELAALAGAGAAAAADALQDESSGDDGAEEEEDSADAADEGSTWKFNPVTGLHFDAPAAPNLGDAPAVRRLGRGAKGSDGESARRSAHARLSFFRPRAPSTALPLLRSRKFLVTLPPRFLRSSTLLRSSPRAQSTRAAARSCST